MPTVPFKANAARRHRIPRQRPWVSNWAEYDASLCQRGSRFCCIERAGGQGTSRTA